MTPVPSVKDGTPVNPYTPYTSDKDGGDGFDLAWAVDISTGEPVKVNNAKNTFVSIPEFCITLVFSVKLLRKSRAFSVQMEL